MGELHWTDQVNEKLKRNQQILFSKNSPFLQDLALLLEGQTHRAVVLWALELAEETLPSLEAKYPGESRPRRALEAAKLWAAGSIKMPIAKREILNCHALAKELGSLEDIALCHAVAQACSTVHTSGHALGFPLYDLTAVIRRCGAAHYQRPVERRKQHYIDRLLYWSAQYDCPAWSWAEFMLK